MSLRRKFERKMKEKEQEIQELEHSLREARAYVEAMQDAIKMLPPEGPVGSSEGEPEAVVKPGSMMGNAVKALKMGGKPMHIMDLLRAIGREPTPEARASLGGSISAYVRRGHIFTRSGPNTFGLAEWGTSAPVEDGPPDDFGSPPVDNA